MEAYRREVEKMKQLQEGKEKNKKEVEKKKTLDLVASKKKKNHGSHHHFPLFLSLCVSLSSFLLSDDQRNAEAQQKFIQQQHENEMVLKV